MEGNRESYTLKTLEKDEDNGSLFTNQEVYK